MGVHEIDRRLVTPRCPKRTLRFAAQLDAEQHATWMYASLAYRKMRKKSEWEERGGSESGETLEEYANRVQRGSAGCQGQWGHCDYCDHGRAAEAMAKFFLHANPVYAATFSCTEDVSPAEGMKLVSDFLTYFVAASPRSHIDRVLLSPSYRSSNPALNGRLHIHASMSHAVTDDLWRALCEHTVLRVSLGDKFSLPSEWGTRLAYQLEQMSTRVTQHPSFRGRALERVIHWERHPYRIARVPRRDVQLWAEFIKLWRAQHPRIPARRHIDTTR